MTLSIQHLMRRLLILTAFLVFAAPAHAAYLGAWGTNNHAQLGTGYKSKGVTVPVPASFAGVKEVCTGGEWGAALLENGQVETWGGNESGQQGIGTRGPYKTKPGVIPGLTAVEVACNGEHAAARLADGSVRLWGSSLDGQECDGHEGKDPATKKPYAQTKPWNPGVAGAVQVAIGGADTLILLRDGSVLGCGENHKGQLGDGTTVNKPTLTRMQAPPVREVSVGGSATVGEHTILVGTDGAVYGLGLNNFGQIGDGTVENRLLPVPVLSSSVELNEKALATVAKVSAGPDHSLALLSDGTVLAWGQANYGQLGALAGSKCGGAKNAVACALVPQIVPGLGPANAIAAGTHFSLVACGGRPYSFGQNKWLTLGDGTRADKAKPTLIAGGLLGVSDLAAGYFNGFAVTTTKVIPELSVASGKGSLTVNWISQDMHNPWHVAIRALTKPVQPFPAGVKLAPGTRSYTFGGLAKGEYEIRVGNTTFGQKIATGNAS
jgi:alpha-tubulin suppressor-like RCC1 family protein